MKSGQPQTSNPSKRNGSRKHSIASNSNVSFQEGNKPSKFERTDPLPFEKVQESLVEVKETHRFYQNGQTEPKQEIAEMAKLKGRLSDFI